jgi:hypothetical protein
MRTVTICYYYYYCYYYLTQISTTLINILMIQSVGYNYLWGREWLNYVKLFPPSERNIQIIIKQITIAMKNIYEKIWPVAFTHNLILFTVCPSFIYFDSSMKNVKLSFWWYDLLSPDFVNPDPAKYFFVGM